MARQGIALGLGGFDAGHGGGDVGSQPVALGSGAGLGSQGFGAGSGLLGLGPVAPAQGHAQAHGEGLLVAVARLLAAARGGHRQLGVGTGLHGGQVGGAAGHFGLVLPVGRRRVLGSGGRGVGHGGLGLCLVRQRQGGRGLHTPGGQCGLRCVPRALGLGHGGFGLGHGAVGLRLVGARQVARTHAARHVGGQALRVQQPVLRQGPVSLRALRGPPGFAHGGGQLQLRGALAAVQRLQFRVGKCGLAGALAGQPQRQGQAHFGFAAALVAAGAVGFGGQLQRHGLGRPGCRRAACGLRGFAPQSCGLRFRLALPGLLEQGLERERRCAGVGGLGLCGTAQQCPAQRHHHQRCDGLVLSLFR